MFTGSIVALITPFTNGSVDIVALRKLVKWHIDNGTQGLVPVGTTGEAPALSKKEHKRVVEIVCYEAGGQIPVIAGSGSNNTKEAVKYTRHAAKAGANAALHVTGYYNRPSQEGIYQHFQTLNSNADLPIVVYNIPPRVIVDILPETMARLSELDNIVGVKDATGDLARPLQEHNLISREFSFLSGEDTTAVAYNANGGNGCISVVANVAPALSNEMQQACMQNNYPLALQLQRRLMPLIDAIFLEPNPGGVKYANSLLKLCTEECRLPMVKLKSETKARISEAMRQLDLI
jgi:4-hydroxy-tetrahydrodipicolinate synthase